MVNPNKSYKVRRAVKSDVNILADGMARVFNSDTHYEWTIPDADARVVALATLFRAHLRWGIESGVVHTTEELDGCAVWMPRHPKINKNFERTYAALNKLYPRMTPDEARYTPDDADDYAHLTSICAFVQHQGTGSALLNFALPTLDLHKTPALLEATTGESRDFYERFGFRQLGEFALAGGGPVYYPMWREPQEFHL